MRYPEEEGEWMYFNIIELNIIATLRYWVEEDNSKKVRTDNIVAYKIVIRQGIRQT